MHRLHLLGRVDLLNSQGEELRKVLAQPKRLAILAFLAADPAGVSRRDRLLGVFWPDLDQERARKALNKSIHFLRQALGEPAIVSRNAEELTLDRKRVWCDAVAFTEAIEGGQVSEGLELYRGDLLPSFYIEGSAAFDEWVEAERARLRRLAGQAAHRLALEREREGQWTTAIGLTRRAVELSDDDERTVRQLLDLLDRLGDRAGALYAFDKFARRLASEFGVEPAAETRALIARVRSRAETSNGAAAQTDHAASSRSPGTGAALNVPADAALAGSHQYTRHSGQSVEAAFRSRGYAIERELGRGGMATVYLAHDGKHDRRVAVKVLAPEVGALRLEDRFASEIRVTARLDHPNILPLFDSGSVDGLLYYVMPYVKGESLRARLTREKRLPVDEAIHLISAIAGALEYAHRCGVVHRDIKPENILLQDGRPLLSDFGIALALSSAGVDRITMTGLSLGTPQYMSPEQAAGDLDVGPQSDIYSLAAVAYELLAGEPPFTGPNTQAVLARVMLEPPRPIRTIRSTVPEPVESAILKALAKHAVDRFATAAGFATALQETRKGVAPRVFRLPRIQIAAASTLVLVAAATATLLLGRGGWNTSGLDPNVLVVAPFEVLSPNPELAFWREGLVDLLARHLDGAGPLRTVAPTTAVRRWSGRADPLSAASLGRATEAGLAVFGTLVLAGPDSVRVVAALVDVEAQRVLTEIDRRDAADRVDRLADSVALGLLAHLGRTRALGTVGVSSFGSASPPAVKAFLVGEQSLRRREWDSALAAYVRAGELDSTFALAFWRAAGASEGGRVQLTEPEVLDYQLRAGRLNVGLAPRESLLIAADSQRAAHILTSRGEPLARAFVTLDQAIRRYPQDAEVWYRWADARFHFGVARFAAPEEEMLRAFERAVVLDSLSGPPYQHLIELALAVRRPDIALRHVEAELRLRVVRPDSLMRLLLIRDPREDPHLNRATAGADMAQLGVAWFSTRRWPDSAETAIQLARQMSVGNRGTSGIIPAPPETYLARSLSFRGFLREALKIRQGRGEQNEWVAELLLLGAAPAETTARVFDTWLRQASPLGGIAMSLPWWASRRDTARLALAARTGDSVARVHSDHGTRLWGMRLAESARAYMALARLDSAGALRRFTSMPDSLRLCDGCEARGVDRLTQTRLLVAARRDPDAARILETRLRFFDGPLHVVWALEGARVAERIGEPDKARERYAFVTEAWRRADENLQPLVEEARAALARLEKPERGRI